MCTWSKPTGVVGYNWNRQQVGYQRQSSSVSSIEKNMAIGQIPTKGDPNFYRMFINDPFPDQRAKVFPSSNVLRLPKYSLNTSQISSGARNRLCTCRSLFSVTFGWWGKLGGFFSLWTSRIFFQNSAFDWEELEQIYPFGILMLLIVKFPDVQLKLIRMRKNSSLDRLASDIYIPWSVRVYERSFYIMIWMNGKSHCEYRESDQTCNRIIRAAEALIDY